MNHSVKFAQRRVVSICAGLTFSAALVAAPASAQTIAVDVGATPSADVMPLAPGGLQKALDDLPAMVADTLKRSGAPGAAVVVVHGGRTVFSRGFGVRELGKPARIDTETVFQIASMSKPVSATIAAIQVTAGVVSWNDRVSRHLPALALSVPYVGANAIIGDFFAHRSGLPAAAGDDLEDIGFGRSEIIRRLRVMPLNPFRITYGYANYGITIGAEAVAAAAGKDWETLADQALFAPLGMTSTSYRHADFLKRDNRAVLHARVDGRFQPLYQRQPDAQAPAGGVSSSVTDLAEWLKLLLANGKRDGRQLFSPQAMLPALGAQAFSAPARNLETRAGFYGYGFNVDVDANGRPSMNHSGAFLLGAATNVVILPGADVAIITLTNAGPVGVPEAVNGHFMDLVQYGASTRDWFGAISPVVSRLYAPVGDLAGLAPPAQPAAAQPLAAYVGAFQNDYFGEARIVQEGGALVFKAGPGDFQLRMKHWNGDVFSVQPSSENAPQGSLSSLRFEMKDGKANGFTVNYLNGDGLAIWQR